MASQIESEGNIGGLDGFIDDNEGYGPHIERRFCQRHTPQQLMCLEESYKKCAHPDVNQQHELAMELGLEYKQIKFWFQNKRTQSKVQNERGDNEFLHAEIDRIRCENTTILKNINCSACKGLPSEENDIKNPILLKLRQENAALKSEYEKLSIILAHSVRRYLEQQSYNIPIASLASHGNGRPALGVDSVDRKVSHANPELEKLLVVKTATNAMNELINLLNVDQPIWKKCSDGEHYAFNGDNYHRFFPNSAKHVYVNPRVEASKYSEIFPLNAEVLLDLFLKPGRWGDMFPTFFYKARTVHVLDSGLRGTRSGAMQLIYEHMHALSPLIRPREFELVRYCKQIKTGEWVIADASCKTSMGSSLGSSTWCWKLPSGCMIQQLTNNVCLGRGDGRDELLTSYGKNIDNTFRLE